MGPDAANRRTRDLLEIAVGYTLILLVIWTPRPWQSLLYWVAIVFLATVLWLSFEGHENMGLRTANLARSAWVVGVAALIAAAAILIAHQKHTLNLPNGTLAFLRRYWGYSIWAFAQQILLQDFFLSRFQRLIPSTGLAALAAGLTFSLAHLPNPILTILTLVWGFAACLLFLYYRNLYPLAIAHAILGVTIAITLAGPLIRNMRVGLGYYTYAQHRGNHRIR
jgi:membrane protease YdiL (CAAX protease family)